MTHLQTDYTRGRPKAAFNDPLSTYLVVTERNSSFQLFRSCIQILVVNDMLWARTGRRALTGRPGRVPKRNFTSSVGSCSRPEHCFDPTNRNLGHSPLRQEMGNSK